MYKLKSKYELGDLLEFGSFYVDYVIITKVLKRKILGSIYYSYECLLPNGKIDTVKESGLTRIN